MKKLSFLLSTILLISSGLSLMPPQLVSAAFDQNMIMTDAVFDNVNTMDAATIDAFLNRYPSSCLSTNNGFTTPDIVGYNPSDGFLYGGNVSAGTAIYNASQAYRLNPQVILATLQKESSVVTGDAPYHCQYINTAMGYDCPDSGSCPQNPATESGFSKQIIHATWMLRFHEQRSEGHVGWQETRPGWDNSDDPQSCYSGRMTQGNFQICPSGPTNYYDGYTTIDGTSVHLESGATAALYDYTPHFSGNQHFVTIFENTFGFGSTTTGFIDKVHPDGTLVRPANSPKVYQFVNGKAQFIPSLGVFRSWGLDFGKVKVANQSDLNLMAASDADTSHTSNPAPRQFREGVVIKGSGPAIYAIKNSSGVNSKRLIDSWDTFTRLGYKFDDVIAVADSELPTTDGAPINSSTTTHPDGSLIKSTNSPAVYYLINGERHQVATAAIFSSQGFSWNFVKTSTVADDQLPLSWAVTWYGEGTLIKGSGPAVYIVDIDVSGVHQSKRSFSYYTFVGLDYRFQHVMWVSDSELPSTNGSPVGQ